MKASLIDWLELLSVSLPPEIGLHELIDTLKHSVEEISQRHENLKMIIDKHPLPENEYSMSCRKGMKPFMCGFWKLLHVMSVGFAVRHRSFWPLLSARHTLTSVTSAVQLRVFIIHFMCLMSTQNIQSDLYVRISAHVYNELHEYERLADAILVWARNSDAK